MPLPRACIPGGTACSKILEARRCSRGVRGGLTAMAVFENRAVEAPALKGGVFSRVWSNRFSHSHRSALPVQENRSRVRAPAIPGIGGAQSTGGHLTLSSRKAPEVKFRQKEGGTAARRAALATTTVNNLLTQPIPHNNPPVMYWYILSRF